jgi:RNA polymerase sigma-70 factor (ECF subfamily)
MMPAAVSIDRLGPDHALVSLAVEGESEAREELARQIRRPAYLLALQLTGRPEDARDVAQDCLLRFFQHLDRFDVSRPVKPWLYQIVRNRVRDLRRRARLRRHESLDAMREEGRPEPAAASPSPAADAETRELQQSVWSSLGELKDPHREILVLRDYQDLSYSEIAEVLAIPQGTVMSRLHAARRSLRALLTPESDRQVDAGDA